MCSLNETLAENHAQETAELAGDRLEADAQEVIYSQAVKLLEEMRHRDVLELLANAYQEGLAPCADLKLLEAEAQEGQVPPNVSGALHAYEEALALEPGHEVAHYNRVQLLMRQDGVEAPTKDAWGLAAASNDDAPLESGPVFYYPTLAHA